MKVSVHVLALLTGLISAGCSGVSWLGSGGDQETLSIKGTDAYSTGALGFTQAAHKAASYCEERGKTAEFVSSDKRALGEAHLRTLYAWDYQYICTEAE
jgi:hypothetical protein